MYLFYIDVPLFLLILINMEQYLTKILPKYTFNIQGVE